MPCDATESSGDNRRMVNGSCGSVGVASDDHYRTGNVVMDIMKVKVPVLLTPGPRVAGCEDLLRHHHVKTRLPPASRMRSARSP